jgi:putative transposase
LEEYGIQTTEDIQDALTVLLGGTIKEMDEHLDYEKSERSDDDSCNQYKHKQVNNRFKSIEIQVPQDRKSAFEP